MNREPDLNEARLERLILGAAATCIVAVIYLLISSLLN